MPPVSSARNQTTRAWFQRPDRADLRTAIRQRLSQLTDPPQNADQPAPAASLPSPDGRWLAWAVTDPATDLQIWQIERASDGLDGSKSELVRDNPPQSAQSASSAFYSPVQIRDVYPSGIAWLPDGTGFYYDRYLPYPGGHGLYFHAVGTSQADDTCLLYQPAHPEWYYQLTVSPDGRWLAVSTLNGSAANLLTVRRTRCPKDTQSPTGRATSPTYLPLVSRFTGRYDILHWRGDELICRAVEPNALNGQLIAFDLSPLPAQPPTRRTLLPPSDLPLLDAAPLGEGWVASYLNRGAAELHWLDGQGKLLKKLPLPGLGTVGWLETASEVGLLAKVQPPRPNPPQIGEGTVTTPPPNWGRLGGGEQLRLLAKVQLLDTSPPDTPRLRFVYSDFAQPAQVYTWRPGDAAPLPEGDPPALAFDPQDFVTRTHTVPSADGAAVPLFIAQRRDVTSTARPTLLHAYGGLGYSLTPRFSADVLAWLEMGGLFVSVCARGGGELGERWHQAAVGVHKQRTFDDVLAVAQWLVGEGMTTPQQLGLWGASNGGLTAGACLTQQPDLFCAVVIESGLLDMLDYHRLGRGADWLAEYGDPDDSTYRPVLAGYSPLHNIRPGTPYPATLITTSDNDPRVGEAHSLRFAEKLQAAQSGDAPIRLRVDPGGGHGDQPSPTQWLDRAADRLAFFAVHLGL